MTLIRGGEQMMKTTNNKTMDTQEDKRTLIPVLRLSKGSHYRFADVYGALENGGVVFLNNYIINGVYGETYCHVHNSMSGKTRHIFNSEAEEMIHKIVGDVEDYSNKTIINVEFESYAPIKEQINKI